MDPVLSSTFDFDEYIQSNLNFSGQKKAGTISDSKYSRYDRIDAKERPRSGNSTRSNSRYGSSGALNSSYSDYKNDTESKDISQDFFQLNITKYGQVKPALVPPRSVSNKTKDVRQDLGGAPTSPTPPIVLQHSWKAHLARPSAASSSRPTSSSGASTRNYPYYDDEDDGISDSPPPRPQPPLYRSPAPPLSPNRLSKPSAGWSLYSSTHHTGSSIPSSTDRSNNNYAVSNHTRNSNDLSVYGSPRLGASVDRSLEGDFGQYKVRLVTLKRCFATWAQNAVESAEKLVSQTKDVAENCVYWPKRSCFTWWKMLTQATSHVQVVIDCYACYFKGTMCTNIPCLYCHQMLRFRRGLRKWYIHYRVSTDCNVTFVFVR